MSTAEITSKVTELQELRRMAEELDAEITAIQDEIKNIMGDNEILTAGPYKVMYQFVTSSRLDTKAIQKDLPDVAAQYTRTTTTRRFTVK